MCVVLLLVLAVVVGFHFDQLRRHDFGVKPTYDYRSANPKTVLMPLPDWGFDPTEAAVSWKTLSDLGHKVVFATPTGKKSEGCDPTVLKGILGGTVMKIFPEPEQFYQEMIQSPEYAKPISYDSIDVSKFDGLLVPGGHAAGMNDMLRNEVLLTRVSDFFAAKKPVAAICHGLLALTRAKAKGTNHSVLEGRKVTGLPYYLELQGYLLTHYAAGLPGSEYQLSTTWPHYVEDEVVKAVGPNGKYDSGPVDMLAPLLPGSRGVVEHTFVMEDDNLITSRFWGDTYIFAQRFARKLDSL